NMYAPIWDNGENGTPVNDTNYYALYLYKTIQMYGDNVDIWEITNEPDLTGSPASYQGPEIDDSWWNRDPTPCELAIKAPIQYYIRMLRISYEVIKSEQPDDFIALGGVGFPSFVDGLLRNTDNPDHGLPTNEFPLKGGAYFDVLSFHTYPHIDGSTREWSNSANGFVYFRHSDRTVDQGYLKSFRAHKKVLEDHGYNGNLFPKKHFIVTETNIPSKQFGEYIGSKEAQRNYTMKVLLKSMQVGIEQVHFFTIAEEGEYFTLEFSHMGLYKKLGANIQSPTQLTEQGIAFKTTTLLTKGYVFDPEETAALELPPDVDGLALKNQEGKHLYALWAKTYKDRNESASANYTIPVVDENNVMEIYDWDYSITHQKESVPGQKLSLTETPRFFKPIGQAKLAFEIRPKIYPNPAHIDFQMDYTLFDDADVEADLYDLLGQHVLNVLPKTHQLPGNYSTTITTEFFPAGTYILKIKARQQTIIQKMMVQHY
ncbi:MAG TPA: T9SS type A sorting domain-containing protein, partial [Saprospiraceae bacterium]|nr:T9SS type A sorting domain-containing protein [Saprospiraceae bacterium]